MHYTFQDTFTLNVFRKKKMFSVNPHWSGLWYNIWCVNRNHIPYCIQYISNWILCTHRTIITLLTYVNEKQSMLKLMSFLNFDNFRTNEYMYTDSKNSKSYKQTMLYKIFFFKIIHLQNLVTFDWWHHKDVNQRITDNHDTVVPSYKAIPSEKVSL